jgi:hypothetical protein
MQSHVDNFHQQTTRLIHTVLTKAANEKPERSLNVTPSEDRMLLIAILVLCGALATLSIGLMIACFCRAERKERALKKAAEEDLLLPSKAVSDYLASQKTAAPQAEGLQIEVQATPTPSIRG